MARVKKGPHVSMRYKEPGLAKRCDPRERKQSFRISSLDLDGNARKIDKRNPMQWSGVIVMVSESVEATRM